MLLCDNCSGIAEPSLHVFPPYAVRFKRGQKGHDTRQFEGGALKGKFLPRGGTCPWCPPVPPPMLKKFQTVYEALRSMYSYLLQFAVVTYWDLHECNALAWGVLHEMQGTVTLRTVTY